ncbi:hypothetical protein [Ideonella sp.]|uniref:hypothetical protein n=1 Tax=Ideonella sp. TaxID=1929293 RepID=UPI0035B4FA48
MPPPSFSDARARRLGLFTALAAAFTAALCAAAPAAASGANPPDYRVLHLLDDPAWLPTAYAMNERDQVVGMAYAADFSTITGFRWTPARERMDRVSDFPSGGDDGVELVAVNRQGLAVGHGTVNVGDHRGVLRALKMLPNGRRVALPHPGGAGQSSRAVAVNDDGVIIGHLYDDPWSKPVHAVRWTPDGQVERLDMPADVLRINRRGDIAGVLNAPRKQYAFVQQPDGTRHRFDMVDVRQLRDDGTAVGSAVAAGQGLHAALWTLAGGVELLPRPTHLPHFSCWANGMNSQRQVVGECADDVKESRAVLWHEVNGQWTLVDLTWQVRGGLLTHGGRSAALHITDAGHILVDTYVQGRGDTIAVLAPVQD